MKFSRIRWYVFQVLLAMVRNWPSKRFWPFPLGGWIRNLCARMILEGCGNAINVEYGCRFAGGPGTFLGDNSGIGIRAVITEHVRIGADVMMGPDVQIYTVNHAHGDTSVPMWKQGYLPARPVVIEDDVWIGARVIVLPGVTVGHGSILGAGAVVTRDVPPYSVVVGNPGRVVRSRLTEREQLRRL